MLVADAAVERPEERPDPPARVPVRLGYQPALDGLRAIAVVAVMLYHGAVSWASGGYLGVDVFFVLSGFLITSLLVDEWRRTSRIDIVAFYGRRARRLFPLLAVVLVGVALDAVFLVPASQLRGLRNDVLATVGYATNWHLIFERRGYFDGFTGLSPLTHTWSLAVEEQWYLVWPVVTYGLLRLGRRARRLAPALVITSVLCIASAVWMAVLAHPGSDPSRVYYGTDTRAHELLLGSALGIACAMAGGTVVPRRLRPLLTLAGVAALGTILWLCADVDYGSTWLYEGGMLALSALVAVVVLAAIQPDGVLRRVLGAGAMAFVGRLSYALYLWHFPIYIVVSAERMGTDGTELLLTRLGLTVAASLASYWLIERPVRLRRIATAPLLGLTAAASLIAVGVVLVTTQESPPTPAEITGHAPVRSNVAGDFFKYDPAQNPPPPTTPFEKTTRLVMTGDSVALTLSNGFEQRRGRPKMILWDHSVVGCSLFPGERVFGPIRTDGGPQCQQWRHDRDRWLREFHPDVVAVFSGVWETYDKVVDGRRLRFGTPPFDAWFSAHLDSLVTRFGRTGSRVALLTAPCNQRIQDLTSGSPPENDRRRVGHLNDLYRAAAARHPQQVSLIDLGGFLCPGGRFEASVDGVRVRADDGVHLTPEGAQRARQWLFPQLDALRRR